MLEKSCIGKISLVSVSFFGGGAERVMVTLANSFARLGYNVDFIVFRDEGPYKTKLLKSINKIVLSRNNSGGVFRKVRITIKMFSYLRKSDSSVVMSTLKELNVFLAVLVFLSRTKIKFVAREADTLDRVILSRRIKDKFLLFAMRYFYRVPTKLVANCQVTKQDLIDNVVNNKEKVSVIYNPLDLSAIEQSVNCSLPSFNDRIKLIACGRLCKKKNFSDIILTLPLIAKKYPSIELNILGEGEEKINLLKLVEDMGLRDNVNFLGFVENPYKYYAAADVFVQTSLWEGFGYVLAEAMACGTPVVAYDSKGAMREILEDGKYGLLTPVGDLPFLANAIISQIENPTKKSLLRESAERFNVDNITEEYLKVLLGD